MKTEKFEGKIENAYGKPVSPALPYNASFDAFETIEEVRTANELPKDSEIVDFINAKRKANARQKGMQVALDAAGIIKPTLENDEQLRLKEMVKVLLADGKKSEAEAKSIASTVLGIAWA
jgi:hypothetical protein